MFVSSDWICQRFLIDLLQLFVCIPSNAALYEQCCVDREKTERMGQVHICKSSHCEDWGSGAYAVMTKCDEFAKCEVEKVMK